MALSQRKEKCIGCQKKKKRIEKEILPHLERQGGDLQGKNDVLFFFWLKGRKNYVYVTNLLEFGIKHTIMVEFGSYFINF